MDDPPTTVASTTRAYRIDHEKLRTLADFICARLGVAGHALSVTLVGSAGIRRLNRRFRGLDSATDVLSFPQRQWRSPARMRRPERRQLARSPAGAVLGDVVISIPEAERNARGIGQALDREIGFLIVHGILHLCGHDHQRPAEERRMRAVQRRLMAAIARTPGGPLWAASVKKVRPPRPGRTGAGRRGR